VCNGDLAVVHTTRFRANLSYGAATLVSAFAIPLDDAWFWMMDKREIERLERFRRAHRGTIVNPALRGICDVIGMGAVKVHCPTESMPVLRQSLPKFLAETISAESRKEVTHEEFGGKLLASVLPFLPRRSQKSIQMNLLFTDRVIQTVYDLLVSVRQHRALIIHHHEVKMLEYVSKALLENTRAADDPLVAAIASFLRSMIPIGTSIDTPSIRLPIRRLEILEKLLDELIESLEFKQYGDARNGLSQGGHWKEKMPMGRLLHARDRCLSRWNDLQAYRVRGFLARFTASMVAGIASSLPVVEEAIGTIDFNEYQPTIYALPGKLT